MSQIESTFEEDYNDTIAMIEANSSYGILPAREKKYMTAPEMGQILGLKKTDRYWLLHQHHFEWEEILGMFRINIESFEKWYANQVKYKKVNGEEPGKELKEWTYSPQEIADLLGINHTVVYEILIKNNIETVLIDHWKRVPKEAFYKWYNSQTRYRTKEDRERDAAIENASISMPEMARILGITRSSVYSLLNNPKYKDIFEIIIVADRKRITRQSFERFLESQDKYKLDKINNYEEISMEENVALADYRRKRLKKKQPRTANGNLKYLTHREAALIAKVSRATIYEWISKDCFPVIHVMNTARIPRKEFEQYLKKRKEEGGDVKHGINKRKKR